MNKGIGIIFIITYLMLLSSCCNCFDDSQTFQKDFEARSELFSHTTYFSVFEQELSDEQREALQFLYAYMPSPDITDYSGEFHLMNVDYALKARAEMPWGKQIPDREFLHFVLPARVNNENLDECRKVFYEELKERVGNMSMYDAVLEVNHWCHEKVTYTPSDGRTSAPLSTIRTAHGRCGEESTFTVAALRAIGIPARQIYTPRWAHTDSNHAWVEAWVDGQWYFLGACEPAPVLNMGWFNAPASRVLLTNTYVFGKYQGPEEVLCRDACYTEVNVTANYAPTATTKVQVVDTNGTPVKATVEFKIYNMAELYTAVVKECDDNGCVSLTSGLGDMVAWASKDGVMGFSKFTAGKDEVVKVILDKNANYSDAILMDIVPPVEQNNVPEVTPEQVAHNDMRFVQEDSIRNAYVATFPSTDDAIALANRLGVDQSQVVTLIKQSRGNYQTIISFLENCLQELRHRAISMLFCMSEKDRRDVALTVLNDHFAAVTNEGNDATYFDMYVLNPRVSNEMLTPYRSFFAEVISADDALRYRTNPIEWVKWCADSIVIDGTWNPRNFCMSPRGVWNMRVTDAHSRDIFFVSAARSMGIAARIDEITGKTQYMVEGQWHDAHFDSNTTDAVSQQGTLYADFETTTYLDNPRYYNHFSLSKIEDGCAVLQNYPYDATWQSVLRDGAVMDAGQYLVTSGTRMANGGVLAHLQFVEVKAGEATHINLVMRESQDQLQVIGDFNSENLYYDLTTEQTSTLLSTTGRGYYVLALIDPNSEPTNHFLRDIAPYKDDFDKWGQKMVMLFDNKEAAARFHKDDFTDLPATVVWGTDVDGTIFNEIVTNMKLQSPHRPIIIVADTFNRIVFVSQGYSKGLGEQLVKVIHQL